MSDKQHFSTIFLSDIHLGTRGCQAERLADFLDKHTCDRLFLVGDIVDGWRMQSGVYWPQTHSDVVRKFLSFAKRGTDVIYVTGNHDEFLRRYSEVSLGNLTIVDKYVHTTADDKRLLVMHGDQFDVITRYHRWLAFAGDIGYSILLGANTHVNAVRRRFGYGYWSLSAWLKHRVKQAVNFISEFESAVAHECKRQGYDGAVCGHIHHAEISSIQDVTYMNCGDWVESCTALVEHPDGQFEIIRWDQVEEGMSDHEPAEVVVLPGIENPLIGALVIDASKSADEPRKTA